MGTPRRSIRVDEDTWEAWRTYADDHGLDVSGLIRLAVNGIVDSEPTQREPDGRSLDRGDVTPLFRDRRKGKL